MTLILVAGSVAAQLNTALGSERFLVKELNEKLAVVEDGAGTTLGNVTLLVRNTDKGLGITFEQFGKVLKGRPYPVVGTEDFVLLLGPRLVELTQDPTLAPLKGIAETLRKAALAVAKNLRKSAKSAAKLVASGGGSQGSSVPATGSHPPSAGELPVVNETVFNPEVATGT